MTENAKPNATRASRRDADDAMRAPKGDAVGQPRPSSAPSRARLHHPVIVVDAIAGEKGLLALLQARREYSALERSLERARTENAELREMARRLREDPHAIEEQARRELGLIKPGEMLFIVKDIDKKY